MGPKHPKEEITLMKKHDEEEEDFMEEERHWDEVEREQELFRESKSCVMTSNIET